MTKYNVFISYSRKDIATVTEICQALDNAGISYWMDKQGIDGGQEFPKEIANAILQSDIFLFIASSNSYTSKFTNSEVTFAFNKMNKECLLPYIIDDTELPIELQLVFSNINWRNIKEHSIESVLLDIKRILGKELKNVFIQQNETKKLQIKRIQKIFASAMYAIYFKKNYKYPSCKTPVILYRDVLDYNCIIHDIGSSPVKMYCDDHSSPIVVQYDSIEDLVNDGWYLD